ncbi:MAG: pentapeptide repeat-containing protein [Thiotrichaceae bacterium]|nr:pentapeptide repeat-containing protein [Thiotrichaceae bacterium]
MLFQLITFIVLIFSFLQTSNAQTPKTTSTQLIKLLETNSCPRCDLRGVDLSNMNLVGAKLQYTDLSGANLRNANLSDIDIDVTFEWIEIIGTQLEGAQFKYNVTCGPPPVIGGWGCQHL